MTAEDEEILAAAALAARENAYAPYSHYRVGAAVRTKDGRIFTGCNVENVSFGLTVCAERTAILKAVSEGVTEFSAVAVATSSEAPAAPCGMCRQAIAEFARDLPIVLTNPNGLRVRTQLSTLLPHAFLPSSLPREGA